MELAFRSCAARSRECAAPPSDSGGRITCSGPMGAVFVRCGRTVLREHRPCEPLGALSRRARQSGACTVQCSLVGLRGSTIGCASTAWRSRVAAASPARAGKDHLRRTSCALVEACLRGTQGKRTCHEVGEQLAVPRDQLVQRVVRKCRPNPGASRRTEPSFIHAATAVACACERFCLSCACPVTRDRTCCRTMGANYLWSPKSISG